tara:strand:- start:66 stop:866 length:801 start_codon:yes stop_codon:yes gene_type:complete
MQSHLSMLIFMVSMLYMPLNVNAETPNGMMLIPEGFYTPLFKSDDGPKDIAVDAFLLDTLLVTNKQFIAFTKKAPEWNKINRKNIFSDVNYLKHVSDKPSSHLPHTPVVNVSWFAARAYCKAINKRLPTVAEWEYAAAASQTQSNGKNEPGYKQQILDWYAKPASAALPEVKDTLANFWGVKGMHGVVWELVSDFNTSLITGESRGDSQLEKSLFCGAGAASSADPGDYAAFMRYALRSSYEANYTMESLGFRCAKNAEIKDNQSL